MQVATLIEPIAGQGFRAKTGSPFEITVEAKTRHEAIQQLQDRLRQRLAEGAELVAVEAGVTEHPWMNFAGDLKDDPLLDDWKSAMADYRQQVDQESAKS